MELNEIRKIIENNESFLNLKKKYPIIFLYTVFSTLSNEKFILDLDYYLNKEEVAIFSFENSGINMKISKLDKEMVKDVEKPREIKGKIILEPEIVAEIIKNEIKKIKGSISKLILTLMNQNGKNIWKINCILENLDIIIFEVSDKEKKVIKFERKNLADFVKYLKK